MERSTRTSAIVKCVSMRLTNLPRGSGFCDFDSYISASRGFASFGADNPLGRPSPASQPYDCQCDERCRDAADHADRYRRFAPCDGAECACERERDRPAPFDFHGYAAPGCQQGAGRDSECSETKLERRLCLLAKRFG